MNLILLEPDDFLNPHQVSLSGRRAQHIVQVLRSATGDTVNVGLLNGNLGRATITNLEGANVYLEIPALSELPPPTLPLTLILGLPRPRMLQRTLQTIATMGVEKLCLIQTARVEKSFWQTPLLKDAAVHEQLLLGLEQGKATQLPEVVCYRRFRPFLEDYLPHLVAAAPQRWIAHPGNYPAAQAAENEASILVVGPEGGFIESEVAGFVESGFSPIQLGPRILRVETAIPVLLGRLF